MKQTAKYAPAPDLPLIASGLRRYFLDRHKVDVVQVIGEDAFRSGLFHAVRQCGRVPMAESDQLNKAIMQEARAQLIAMMQNLQEPRGDREGNRAPEDAAVQGTRASSELGPDSLPKQEDTDEAFMHRLQAIELQRRAQDASIIAIANQKNQNAGPTTLPTTNTLPLPGNQMNAQSLPNTNTNANAAAMSPSHSTPASPAMPATISSNSLVSPLPPAPIVIPAPIIRGRVLSLSSTHRAWTQPGAAARASFTWNGPLPAVKDASYVAVAAVQTPAYVLDRHPSLVLRIRGVADTETQTYLLPDLNASSRKWATWRPCESSARYIYPMPTPWTLTLLDNFQQAVAMGADSVQGRLEGAVLTVARTGEAAAIEKGEVLWIGGAARAQVMSVTRHDENKEARIELRGVDGSAFVDRAPNVATPVMGPQRRPAAPRDVDILREDAQWHVMIEVQT